MGCKGFRHRHGEARKTRDPRRDTLEHQNEQFLRDFLRFCDALRPSKRKGFTASRFRHRQDEARDATRDTLEHQNEHFRARLPPLLTLKVEKSKINVFSLSFEENLKILLLQNRCFVPGFRQILSYVTKCHACHGSCTLPPLRAALATAIGRKHAAPHV